MFFLSCKENAKDRNDLYHVKRKMTKITEKFKIKYFGIFKKKKMYIPISYFKKMFKVENAPTIMVYKKC
jgi:hypothetical protein